MELSEWRERKHELSWVAIGEGDSYKYEIAVTGLLHFLFATLEDQFELVRLVQLATTD